MLEHLKKSLTTTQGLGTALMLSLGLNLFLGGFLASRTLAPTQDDGPRRIVTVTPRGIPQGLPAHMIEELESQVREHRRELRRAYRDYRHQQREIERLLVADKVDREALERAYRQLRELSVRMQGPIHEAVIEAARRLDAADRQMIVQLPQMEGEPDALLFGPGRIDGRRWQFDTDGQGFRFVTREQRDRERELLLSEEELEALREELRAAKKELRAAEEEATRND